MNFTFDWNEWFIILSSAIFFSLFFLIRKYFPPVLVIIIWVYNIEFIGSIDYFLVASPFKLYYFSDNSTYEASAALFHLIIYPCASLLFLFGYDKWELYGKKTVWYIIGWTGFSLFFEWLCLKNHVLTYTGWKFYYSIPTYPTASVLLIVLFHFIKKKIKDPIFMSSRKI